MKSVLTALGITVLVSWLAWGWLRQDDDYPYAQEKFSLTTLLTDKDGYILNPPEFVAPPFIRRIDWSPNGGYAVLLQTLMQLNRDGQLEMQHRLLMWSRATKRLQTLWESQKTSNDINPTSFYRAFFLKDTPACVCVVNEYELNGSVDDTHSTVYYAPLGGRVINLGRFEDASVIDPPKDAMRYLVWRADDPATPLQDFVYAPIRADGKLGATRPAPLLLGNELRSTALGNEPVWHADGRQVLAVYDVGTPFHDEAGRLAVLPKYRYLLWNPRTNELREISREEAQRLYEPEHFQSPALEFAFVSVQSRGKRDKIAIAWLVENNQAALVAADSTLAAVSPKGDAILYVAHGAAFYRALVRLDAQQARTLKERLETAAYMRNAGQIAKALLMYANDYDELFPPNYGDEHVAHIISIFLRDKSVFEVNGSFAFRYLLDGQSLATIEAPWETTVGYLELPNGRAVIYADGHVRLEPKR